MSKYIKMDKTEMQEWLEMRKINRSNAKANRLALIIIGSAVAGFFLAHGMFFTESIL